MSGLIALLAILGVLVFVVGGIFVIDWHESRVPGQRRDRKTLKRHLEFIESMRELAWQHRDIDPFAVIVLDEISKFRKQTSKEIEQ